MLVAASRIVCFIGGMSRQVEVEALPLMVDCRPGAGAPPHELAHTQPNGGAPTENHPSQVSRTLSIYLLCFHCESSFQVSTFISTLAAKLWDTLLKYIASLF